MHATALLSLAGLLLLSGSLPAAELRIGSATVDITPDRPVATAGQFELRISTKPDTPIIAAAVAIESLEGGKPVDQSLLISCDLVGFHHSILAKFRAQLQPLLPEMDMRKVVVSATHTHTAPVTSEIQAETLINYPVPKEGVMQPAEYVTLLVDRLCQVATQAWKARQPGGVSWTLGFANVGENRRPVYADGHAEMYGKTAHPRFRHLEASADSGVETLFFWNAAKELQAVAINLACPSQEVEGNLAINADFWHDAREQLRATLHLPHLTILGWCSAAGDQSPHLMYRKEAEARMDRLRGLTRKQEIGRRITHAITDTLDVARADIRTDTPFAHHIQDLQLPPRQILPREYEDAKTDIAQYSLIQQPDNHITTMLNIQRGVLHRYEHPDQVPPYTMELHVLRIGDVAIASNTFELYLDYGIQMKSRSPAQQTLLLQLTNGCGMYLPTTEAIAGGSYSALPYVNTVGPEGGQILVDETVRAIQALFPETPRRKGTTAGE